MLRRLLAALLSTSLALTPAAATVRGTPARSGSSGLSGHPAAFPDLSTGPSLETGLVPSGGLELDLRPGFPAAAAPLLPAAEASAAFSAEPMAPQPSLRKQLDAEADEVLATHLRAGRARRVWGSGAAAEPSDDPVPQADRSEVRLVKKAVAEAAKLFNRFGDGAGDGDPAFWARRFLEQSDIVVVEGAGLIVRRDDGVRAVHVGRRRRTIYVGEHLWNRVLQDQEALAGLLAGPLYRVEYSARMRDEPDEAQAARIDAWTLGRERLVDPEGRLQGHVDELSRDRPAFETLGAGGTERTLPLLLRQALDERADLLPTFLRQWDGAQALLAQAFSARAAEISAERDELARAAGKLRKEAENLSSGLASQNYVSAAARDRRVQQIDRELADLSARAVRASRIGAQLAREAEPGEDEDVDGFRVPNSGGKGYLSSDEHEELLGDLLELFRSAPGRPLWRLMQEEISFTREALGYLLSGDPVSKLLTWLARRPSSRAERLLEELRRRMPDVRVQAHDGAGLYRSAELAVVGVRSESAGQRVLSLDAAALEHWVSEEGRRDLDERLGDRRLPEASDDAYLVELARALAASPDDFGADVALISALSASGVAELERRRYAAQPLVEDAYRAALRANRLRWVFFGLLFLAAIALDAYSAIQGNWAIAGRHAVGYALTLLFTERAAADADWSQVFFKKKELTEDREPYLPPGLRTVIETLARRAGFRARKILLSKHPEPRAIAVFSPETTSLSEDKVIDLVVTESLLERTFARKDTAVFEGALGHAIAHLRHHTRLFLAIASLGVWHVIDHLLPWQGALEWVLWLLLMAPAYLLSWWLFRPQERLADISGARLSGEPAKTAAFLREVHQAVQLGQVPRPAFGLLPREPDLEDRAGLLESLTQDPSKRL